MKLFLLKNIHADWGAYHNSIVCAETKEEALQFMPTGEFGFVKANYWASDPKFIFCQEIGDAHERCKKGVVIAAAS